MPWHKHWHTSQFPLRICRARQNACAVNETLCAITSKQGHACHGRCELAIPLACSAYEALELLAYSRVRCQLGIGW